ncbi:MAG: uL15m family ribosomal protein [Candidatus Woesearchaeota archaeon]
MPINKRKKNSRQRGSWTHGWGAKKKHRGSGNRGGSGMSGTGKRADSKKPSIWHLDYFGKKGFVSKNKRKIVAQNIEFIEKNLEKLLNEGKITKEQNLYVVDGKKLGFNKLLGKGKTKNKFKIYVDFASKKAIAEISSAGGEVIIKNQKMVSDGNA